MLLAREERQKQIVGACCRKAADLGIAPGMPLGVARSLVPGPRVEPHRPDRDAAALRAIAAWSSRFSPLVAVDGDGLLIDVSGCERVFGGEERLRMVAIEQYASLGFESRVAIAPTFACAWAVVRFARTSIVPDGQTRITVERLPIAALRINEEAVQALTEVGIDQVGQVIDLPRSLLPSRFGDELLFRIDQLMGRAMEIIHPVRPMPPPALYREFDGPTTQWEAIVGCTREVVQELCDLLRTREAGVRRLDIHLKRSDLEPAAIRIVLGRPSRDIRHLWSLIYPRLERVNLGTGIEEIRIVAPHIGPMPHQQVEHWNQGSHMFERPIAELLDTLRNRMGPDRVLHGVLFDSHLPERAFSLRPNEDRALAAAKRDDRPTLLFESPFPAEVMSLAPDGPVLTVRWRLGEQRIRSTVGPERIASEWWRRTEPTRDYFKVQDEAGRWLWMYREVETARWFIHGIWS